MERLSEARPGKDEEGREGNRGFLPVVGSGEVTSSTSRILAWKTLPGLMEHWVGGGAAWGQDSLATLTLR